MKKKSFCYFLVLLFFFFFLLNGNFFDKKLVFAQHDSQNYSGENENYCEYTGDGYVCSDSFPRGGTIGGPGSEDLVDSKFPVSRVAAVADDAIDLREKVKDYAYGACASVPNPTKVALLPGKVAELKLKVIELQVRILQDGPHSLTAKFSDLTKKTDEFSSYALAAFSGRCQKSKIDDTSKNLNDLLVFIKNEATKYFLSSFPPQVNTLAAENVSNNSAILKGLVKPPTHNSAIYWFEWGEDQNNLSQKTAEKITGVVSSLNISENISGLSAGKTYYFRLVARTEGSNKVGYGQVASFTTRKDTDLKTETPNNPVGSRINSVSPASASIGSEVVVSGINLESSTRIIFGNLEIPLFDVSSDGRSAKFYVPSGLKSAVSPNEQSCANIGKLITAGNYQISVKNGDPNNKINFEVRPKSLDEFRLDLNSSIKGSTSTGEPVNISKNAITCSSQIKQIETLVDSYLTKKTFRSGNDWDETSWGRRWLSAYSVYLLGVKAYELGISGTAKEKLNLLLRDALSSENIVYDRCGQELGNSCSEDYVAIAMVAAAAKLNGIQGIDNIEEEYIRKAFQINSQGLTKNSNNEVVIENHGKENAVYGSLLFVHLNNAAYAYWLMQNKPPKPSLPSYYVQSNMIPLFQWIQNSAKVDGSDFEKGGDYGWKPSALPAGRFVRAFLGNSAFLGSKYSFEAYDKNGEGLNSDIARRIYYNNYNPQWLTTTTLNQFSLNVSKSGNGSGTIVSNPTGINCGNDCSESYPTGISVTLQATAEPGSVFAGWSNACSGTGVCNLVMDGNKSVTASFSSFNVSGNPVTPPGIGQPGAAGTYTLSLKLGRLSGGTNFIEERQLTSNERSQFRVEIWTQAESPYESGRKIAEGQLDSPISLQPGKYQVSLRGSLPSPYNATREVPSGCVYFSILSNQQTGITCTLQAYDENDLRNYNLPSADRPSGAPPFIEEDASLGSYQFVKNVLDVSSNFSYASDGIISVGFTTLYGKKLMLVGTSKALPLQRDPSTGFMVSPRELKLLVYDITNPFNPRLLKENTLPSNATDVGNIRNSQKSMIILGSGSRSNPLSLFVLENHPFIYGSLSYDDIESDHVPLFVKINSDWSLGEIERFNVKEADNSISNYYSPLSLFRGLDGKPYALAWDIRNIFGCKKIKLLDISSSPASIVGEIDESSLGIGYCRAGIRGENYDESKSIHWMQATPVRVNQKLYLVIPTSDVIGRLHVVERSWVSVFDITTPSNPRFVGKWQMSGLNNQLHFPDASDTENIKIYADAGILEIDEATGYVYDIFPHMGDFQNATFMTSPEKVKEFYKIKGSFRYRNGIIVRKLNSEGNFDYISRYTLCEKEGGPQIGGRAHGVPCGNKTEPIFSANENFEKAFYGIGRSYIKLLPSPGTHSYNGVILLSDLVKSSLIAGLITSDNKLKIIPDSSNEFLKFSSSLSRIVSSGDGTDKEYGKLVLDAHLQQVDDKTFAIFQIHPASIDVVKLTLTQSRPMPSFTTTTTITPPVTGNPPSLSNQPEASPVQGTLYSIRSILNNLRRILNK